MRSPLSQTQNHSYPFIIFILNLGVTSNALAFHQLTTRMALFRDACHRQCNWKQRKKRIAAESSFQGRSTAQGEEESREVPGGDAKDRQTDPSAAGEERWN